MAQQINVNSKNLNNKATIFRLTLEKISFMYDGMFILKLTVNNSILSDKSGVRLRTKNSDKFIRDFSVRTEIIGPLKKEIFYNFVMNEYSFYLPKGFCKNDMDHDVCLLIEALEVSKDAKTQLIGTIKLPVYPRSDVKANYNVELGDSFYELKSSIRLLRPNMKESNLHCGDLFYKAEFCEILEIVELEAEPKSKSPLIRKPEPLPPVKEVSPPPPLTPPPQNIIEVSSSLLNSPRKLSDQPDTIISFGISPPQTPNTAQENIPEPANGNINKTLYNLLSPQGKEEVSIFVRGAENIVNSKQSPTLTYVTCSLKTDETISDSTHVVNKATSHPLWEEILNLSFTADKTQRILSIRVVDFSASATIAEFVLPIKSLEPFFQHHLKLCQAFPQGKLSPTLYVTMIRKFDYYPLSGQEYTFSTLIIKPLSLFHQLYAVSKHPLACFAYLSNDKTQKISKSIQPIDDNFMDVHSPVSSNYVFPRYKKHSMWSYGQLSIPSRLQKGYDTLNFPFLFCQKTEIDTAFTANSFIVLDFYSVPLSADMSWRNNSPVAQSSLKLDKLLYRQLQEGDKCLIKTYDFEINWSKLPLWTVETTEINLRNVESGNKLSIKILLTNKNISDGIYPEPDMIYPVLKRKESKLPLIKNIPKMSNKKQKEPFLYQIRSLRTPPSGNYVFNEPDYSPPGENNRRIIPLEKNHQKSVVNREMLYKNSLKKMQIELLNLREQFNSLQIENESLENKVLFKKTQGRRKQSETLVENENLSMADLHDQYDKLRKKMGSQMSILTDFKMKEKDLTSTSTPDKSQQIPSDLYQKLKLTNENLEKLEKKVKEHENIISNLERILDGEESSKERVDGSYTTFNNQYVDDERNQLYDLIERAENRIKALQNELIDLSRKRGARKQLLRIRGLEQLSPYDDLL